MTLRVGVNLLWLVPGVVGGSEEYTVRALHGLADLAPPDVEVELFALDDLRRAHPDLVARFPTHTIGLRGRWKGLRVAAETTWLPAALRRRRIDVVHHAGGVVPLLTGGARPVLTVHDLQPLDHPDNFSRVKVAYLRAVLPRSVRVAAVVATPSRWSADRVVERMGVAPHRLRVVPHGLGPGSFAEVGAAAVEQVRAARGLARRWVAYPVITYPHKDHATLVRAFARLATDHSDVDLVLTGGAGPVEGEVRAEIARSGVADRIHRTGRVPSEELDALVAGAAVLAFPSRYEGFGNGVLEAMARGVPVVAAEATALPEVVGEAGVLVPTGDVGGWARALAGVLDDEGRRSALAAAGRERAGRFTAARSAEALLGAYRAAAPDSGPGGRAG